MLSGFCPLITWTVLLQRWWIFFYQNLLKQHRKIQNRKVNWHIFTFTFKFWIQCHPLVEGHSVPCIVVWSGFLLLTSSSVEWLLSAHSGIVLLLEVLEKPWNLILDFKGTWKALEKKNFCWKCLKTPWIFAQMGNNIGLYQSNSKIS